MDIPKGLPLDKCPPMIGTICPFTYDITESMLITQGATFMLEDRVKTSRADRCPKCKGYLILERDNYGLYKQCLQCGFIHDLSTVDHVSKQQAEEQKQIQACLYATHNNSVEALNNEDESIESDSDRTIPTNIDMPLILNSLRERVQSQQS